MSPSNVRAAEDKFKILLVAIHEWALDAFAEPSTDSRSTPKDDQPEREDEKGVPQKIFHFVCFCVREEEEWAFGLAKGRA